MDQRYTPSPSIGIIADDLTSAADGGGPFVKKGLRTTVYRNLRNWAAPTIPDVVAIDCASRSMCAAQAARTVEEATRGVAGCSILFKTIDSTLRGHVCEEMLAAYLASNRSRVVIAPAFPEAGRITVNGIQYVNGQPVDASSYASDPVHSTKTSRIADLISADIKDAIILDAENQSDLNAQVAAIDNPEDVLWVGSPGLAQALAEVASRDEQHITATPFAEHSLVVVGSANAISRAQAMQVLDCSFAKCIVAPDSRTNDPQTVLAAIVKKTVVMLENKDIAALIATGGDTMQAILEKLSIDAFDLTGEFGSGFPMGLSKMADGRSLILGMKAGGFGDANTLYSAVERLHLNVALQLREKT